VPTFLYHVIERLS